jgi:DNA-binding PadR family transcriptional regulator
MSYMTPDLGIWEIAVLALLREDPMHPYQMQRLLRMRHKDEILALKRGSLYHAIARLLKAELIAIETTGRHGRRPERTTYRLTAQGQQALIHSLRNMVSVPRREPSDFMAAMSFLVHLPSDEAVALLHQRSQILEAEIAARTSGLSAAAPHVPRIHLIESEYLVAILSAELAWVRALEADLHAGKLTWNFDQIVSAVQAERNAAGAKKES